MYGFRTASRMNSAVLMPMMPKSRTDSGEAGRIDPARVAVRAQKQQQEDDAGGQRTAGAMKHVEHGGREHGRLGRWGQEDVPQDPAQRDQHRAQQGRPGGPRFDQGVQLARP